MLRAPHAGRPLERAQTTMNPKLKRTVQYLLTVVFGQGLAFLLLPVVTRFLDPVEYGEYALALSISGLVGMFGSGWVRNVGLRLYYDAGGRGTTRGFYLGTTLAQAVMASALYAVVVLALQWSGFMVVSLDVLLAAGIMLIIGDQYGYAVTLLRAEERSTAFTVAEIGSGLVRFGATLGGLYAGFVEAELLFAAMAAAYLVGAAFAVPVLWRRLTGPIRIDRVGVGETLRAGPAALPFSVAAWLDNLASRLILEGFLGTAVVGVFSVGYSIGERLVGSLTQAVFMMAWPSVLNAWREGGVAPAREALRDAQRIYAFLTVGPVLFLIVSSADVTRLLAGPEYRDASSVIPLVAGAMWLRGLSSYLNRHLELEKRFARLSTVALVGAVVNVGLSLALVKDFGMLGVATATVVSNAGTCAFYFLTRDRRLTALRSEAFAAAAALAAAAWGASRLTAAVVRPCHLAEGDLQMLVFVVVYALGVALVLLGGRLLAARRRSA